MPAPARLKIVPYGTIDGGQDWSTTVTTSPIVAGGSFDLDNLQAISDDFEAIFQTWANAVRGQWSPSTVYLGTKLYWYGVGGDKATQVALSPASTGFPGTATNQLPTQCCLVCTMRTGRAGRSFRGRSYMPFTGGPIGADNQTNTATALAVAVAYQAALRSLNSYTNPTDNLTSQRVVVASAELSVLTPILSISVDTRVDIQRRRADKIVADTVEVELI